MTIELNGLTKHYGVQTAVNGISLSIQEPGIVGFLGPNGAGKSTTMKMLAGFISPDKGTAKISGLDVASHPIEIKQKIGYLPESNPLYMDMYVREYLSFIQSVYPLDKKDRKEQIAEAIRRVGLGLEAHKKIGQLSKGYKQRVGLAAAIIHHPDILILDEPTSGLDPNQLVEIRALIKELGKEKIVLLSTHIMQEVEAMCDRVIIIHKGNIVADDSLINLKKQSDKKILKVGFEESLEAEWLNRLPAVSHVEKTDSNHWVLETEDIDSLRKQVMQLAAENNFSLTDLQTTGGSLEDIFRSVTSEAGMGKSA